MNIPGIYTYDPISSTIIHVLYFGNSWLYNMAEATSDGKYILINNEVIGMRNIIIYNSNHTEIKRYGYSKEWNLNGYCIEILIYFGKYKNGKFIYAFEEESDELLINYEKFDDELLLFGNEYLQTFKYDEINNIDIGISIVVEIDFITGERKKIIRGEYFYIF